MALWVHSDGRKHIRLSLLIGFVDVFPTEQFAARFELSSLSMNKFLGSGVQAETEPSWRIVEALETRMRACKRESSISVVAIADPPL